MVDKVNQNNNGPRIVAIALFFALAVLLAVSMGLSGVYTVEPDGQSVVKRLGKVVRISEPGLHFKIPFGIERQYFIPTERVLKEEFGFRTVAPGARTVYEKRPERREESLMLTGDLKVIDVEWVVQYRIENPDRYLHQVRDNAKAIRDISEAVMRRIVGNSLGSDVLTEKRVKVAQLARDEIQEILASFEMGVRIQTVELQDVTPPEPVKPAFNEVNEAEQEREKLINEAEKKRNQVIPRAQGKAEQVLEEAEGYRASRVNGALGEAGRFSAIYKEYQNAKEITRRRLYLEMIDEVLPALGQIYITEEGQSQPLPLLTLGAEGPLLRPAKKGGQQ
ncbi:MAG: FtsH protease activity modulator HflK [Candidatus Hydrogenedentes bacterium]|nr:FtsH protease activity modulator HflK [Candidatus Hydrogenedentota bacterium]